MHSRCNGVKWTSPQLLRVIRELYVVCLHRNQGQWACGVYRGYGAGQQDVDLQRDHLLKRCEELSAQGEQILTSAHLRAAEAYIA